MSSLNTAHESNDLSQSGGEAFAPFFPPRAFASEVHGVCATLGRPASRLKHNCYPSHPLFLSPAVVSLAQGRGCATATLYPLHNNGN